MILGASLQQHDECDDQYTNDDRVENPPNKQ